ncbi:MAG: glycosyltransferase [Alphaproteobacteria bacterium]|nr:glycosyltransferase [Alphaproteobacteria bacterium]
MRILQAMAGAQFGGAEVFFERLVMGLHKAGIDQQVILRNHETRSNTIRKAGVEVVEEVPFSGLIGYKTKRKFKKMIKQFQPDIVFTWMNRASCICPQHKGRFIQVGRLGGYYDLKYYKNCEYLVCNTQDILDYVIEEGWSVGKAYYLPNFVDITKGKAIKREELGIPKNAKVVLGLGRHHENKGFDVLLDAIAKVDNTFLLLAGDGPLRKELEAQAQSLGIADRVNFLGWVEGTPDLFATADMLVCSSRHEPLGNIVLEGWAHQVPVVAALSQGPASLIDDGHTGLLTPLNDSVAMADAIKRVINHPDLAQDMVRFGLERYEENFSESIIIDKYKDFFERIIYINKERTA